MSFFPVFRASEIDIEKPESFPVSYLFTGEAL
jgi:hypothetical protein